MDKKHFDERLKIACFRSITKQLRDRCLITRDEFEQVQKLLRQREIDLLAAKPCKSKHSRDSVVSE